MNQKGRNQSQQNGQNASCNGVDQCGQKGLHKIRIAEDLPEVLKRQIEL